MFSEDEIWGILNLPPDCSDEKQVRRAYKKALLKTRPDEDPQGFMRLRQAYERARQQAIFRAQICEEGSLSGENTSYDMASLSIDFVTKNVDEPIVKSEEQDWHSLDKTEEESKAYHVGQATIEDWAPVTADWIEDSNGLAARQEEQQFQALLIHVKELAQNQDTVQSHWLCLLGHPLLQNLDRFEIMRKRVRDILLESTGVWSADTDKPHAPAGWCPTVALAYYENFGFGDEDAIPGWSERDHTWFRSLFLDALKLADHKKRSHLKESEMKDVFNVGANFETIERGKPVPILFRWWMIVIFYVLLKTLIYIYGS